jgi:hypothetical protein
MADHPNTPSGPLTDLIPLRQLLRHGIETLGSRYLAAQVLEPKVLSCAAPIWVRRHRGSPHARVLYGSPLGPLVAEEQATPELLRTLCEETGLGFAGLLHDDDGIYVNGETVFVLVSRYDVARFLPPPELPQQPEPTTREPLDPAEWLRRLINYDAEQSAVIKDASRHQRRPHEVPWSFSQRIERVMDAAWRNEEVSKAWSAGYIANQIGTLDLWPRE